MAACFLQSPDLAVELLAQIGPVQQSRQLVVGGEPEKLILPAFLLFDGAQDADQAAVLAGADPAAALLDPVTSAVAALEAILAGVAFRKALERRSALRIGIAVDQGFESIGFRRQGAEIDAEQVRRRRRVGPVQARSGGIELEQGLGRALDDGVLRGCAERFGRRFNRRGGRRALAGLFGVADLNLERVCAFHRQSQNRC